MHDNLQFVIDNLQSLKILPRITIDNLCDAVACNVSNKNCMYGMCPNYKNSSLSNECVHDAIDDVATCETCNSFKPKLKIFDPNELVTCHKWITKTEFHDGKKSTVMIKDLQIRPLSDIVDSFTEMLLHIRKHTFNIRHQYMRHRLLRTKLTDTDCLMHRLC